MNHTYLLVISVLVVATSSTTITYAQNDDDYQLPAWVKDTAKFWADDSISDSEFFNMISFLIDKNIIKHPYTINGVELDEFIEESFKRNFAIYNNGYVDGYNDAYHEGLMDGSFVIQDDKMTPSNDKTRQNNNLTSMIKQPQANNVTRELSDGTLVSIYTSKPTVNERMQINVDFIDAKHVNYDLLVWQKNNKILHYKDVHIPNGAGTYTTPPLHSPTPVEITIIFTGYGIGDAKTGPIGDFITLSNIDKSIDHLANYLKVTIEPAPGSSIDGCQKTADGCFTPYNATVHVGDTIVFSNTDVTAHTFTSVSSLKPDGTFDTFILNPGESFEWIPDDAGVQSYYCALHPWATGLITVQEAKEYPNWHKDAKLLIKDSVPIGDANNDGIIMYIHPYKQSYSLGDTVQVLGKINPIPFEKIRYTASGEKLDMHEKISTRLYLVDEAKDTITQVLVMYCYLDKDSIDCSSGGNYSRSFLKYIDPKISPDGTISFLNTFQIDMSYTPGMYYISMSHSITNENLGFVKSETFMIR